MSELRVHVLLLDRDGHVFRGPDGACPHTALEPGETPFSAARRALGAGARWLGTVHSGADASGPFVVLVLASDQELTASDVDVPGGRWTLERARSLDWEGDGPPEEQRAVAAGAERRQLTVLFCDLVGSTALASRIDAEELRERMAAFQRTCSDTIARFDGFVARYMGDGLLAYFGFPQAWGDDAERAVRAGLAIQEAVATLEGASVRVGIATGEVVVGDILGTGAAQERVVVGETPNLAARLQALARPGQVLLAPATVALTRSSFVLEDAGVHELKGFPTPVQVHRAIEPCVQRKETAPIVGRASELERLREAWVQREAVVLVGEAGVGKSRLVDAFVASFERPQRWQSSRWHGSTALFPVVEALRSVAPELLAGVDPETVLLVEALVAGNPVTSSRDRVLDSLADLVAHLAGDSALAVLEDSQWADPTTLALLDRLARRTVMVLTTQRPGAGWRGGTEVRLGPLEEGAVGAWLEQLGLEPRARNRIVERAGGNPLYVQELARLVANGGADMIPTSLKDVLAARLGRGAARAVARSAAGFGGPFDPRHLEAVHGGSAAVVAELTRDGVFRRSEDGRYDFTHALLRDAAYDTLLRRDRQALHGRIADVLVDSDPEQRATHLDLAERFAESWPEWEAAARLSAKRFAAVEAVASYGRALDAARRGNAPPRSLLALGVERAAHLRLMERHDETAAALDQAERDGAGAGLVPEVAQLWFHRGNLFFLQGEAEACRAAHQKALALASEGGWVGEQARAWGGLGDAHYAMGAMADAREAFERCVELSRVSRLDDVAAANLPMVALTSFFLGEVDVAERYVRQAIEAMIGGAHRGLLTAGVTQAICAHFRGLKPREELEAVLRPQLTSPLYSAFRAWGLSLVAPSDEQARADIRDGLASLTKASSLGIRGPLLARWAAIDRDRHLLAQSLEWIAPPTPMFVRLFAAPHALHAARRIGDGDLVGRVCSLLEGLGTLGAPWASRVAAWGRGAVDPQLDAIFPA